MAGQRQNKPALTDRLPSPQKRFLRRTHPQPPRRRLPPGSRWQASNGQEVKHNTTTLLVSAAISFAILCVTFCWQRSCSETDRIELAVEGGFACGIQSTSGAVSMRVAFPGTFSSRARVVSYENSEAEHELYTSYHGFGATITDEEAYHLCHVRAPYWFILLLLLGCVAWLWFYNHRAQAVGLSKWPPTGWRTSSGWCQNPGGRLRQGD